MFDRFNRRINYLRVSVTDRCNLRCVYCMPPEGVTFVPHEEILSFEEIADFTRVAVELGIDKVRMTGGEPLVRKGVVTLVEMLARIEGIGDLAMTTNGVLLAGCADQLAEAGLGRVNVSLDAVDPRRFSSLTHGGNVESVLASIDAAISAGLSPIKINCVVERSSREPDARAVAEYARGKGVTVRFIRRMDLASGRFWPVQGGHAGNCAQCNRLRLSSTGMVHPCLFGDRTFSVRELGPRRAIEMALEAKPESGKVGRDTGLYQIGG